MSEPLSDFKVIIAGGSVAGLTLANALEKAGVDYVLLEKRDIAPELGFALLILPCTTVVHDQLGVSKNYLPPAIPFNIREHFDGRGGLVSRTNEGHLIGEKGKRPLIMIERSRYLRALRDGISDQSKLRSREGIVSYEEGPHGVTVTTDKGNRIQGSLLVGADGIHSAIRGMMHPTVDTTKQFETTFRVLIGTSFNHHVDNKEKLLMAEGSTNHTIHPGVGGLACQSIPGKIFWAMYVPLEKKPLPESGKRTYSESDIEEAISECADVHCCAESTFGDLYRSRTATIMVPLEEGVVDLPWSSTGGRVALVGDAVHKTTATLGLGGNAAVDGVCYLMNELVPLLRRTSKAVQPRQPTSAELATVMKAYERQQRPRAAYAMNASYYATRFETMHSWWAWVVRWIYGWLPVGFKVRVFSDFNGSAPVFDWLPHPDAVEGKKEQ
ncbi:FAD-dependent monooxygenase paxM [Apiospora rasikravindrae]|uniref:FAD-dependent monooxygenase paxM n=1 Tax=Apiospora rasikravindrae TaxID=990691 RepID=A0ABR1TWV2_9PEZI